MLEPGVDFLNHGSFGAVPRVVFDEQAEWRRALMPVHAQMAGRIGPELLQQVYAATGHAPALAAGTAR